MIEQLSQYTAGSVYDTAEQTRTGQAGLKSNRIPSIIMYLFLFLSVQFFMLQQPIQAAAAQNVSSTAQMEKVFRQSIKKGENTISFQSSDSYTTVQIQNGIQNAALSQNRLLMGSMQITRHMDSSGKYQYTISVSDDAFIKVKILKSKTVAVKAAAESLKSGTYTNFYSEVSYYDVFLRLLQQHPEYNYDTSVWKSTNGAYGYQRSAGLTKKQLNEKIKTADSAAAKAVKNCVKSGMTDKQKAKAIHNYIVNHCQYARTQNAFTAYGALVDQTAVCQGYAAAFNLMAAKCGLKSMTVCGTAKGGAHAWNYVKIGSKYRYIDCTWDDTGDIGTGIIQTYFNVTANKLKETHSWNQADFPSGDIKYYKYFL